MKGFATVIADRLMSLLNKIKPSQTILMVSTTNTITNNQLLTIKKNGFLGHILQDLLVLTSHQ